MTVVDLNLIFELYPFHHIFDSNVIILYLAYLQDKAKEVSCDFQTLDKYLTVVSDLFYKII